MSLINSKRSEVLIRFKLSFWWVRWWWWWWWSWWSMDTFGLVALVALYCNGLASNSWYMLVGYIAKIV